MATLGDITDRIRAKNAGPFCLTIDIFCFDADALKRVSECLPTERVAAIYGQPPQQVRRFEIADLAVLKFSMPRPVVQGSRADRDMHASQYAWLLEELEIT